MKRFILVTLTILWMIVIFLFSNSNGEESTRASNYFVNKITPIVEKTIDGKLTDKQIEDYIARPIRKGAHFIEYFILGVLMTASICTYTTSSSDQIIISIFICILYAASDEFHQTFISGRSGQITDVLIDTLGSLCGISLVSFFLKGGDL